MKKQFITALLASACFAGLSQTDVNLSVAIEGPDPCTGAYTLINNSTGPAVVAGTVEFEWNTPAGIELITGLASPSPIYVPEIPYCNQPGVICFGPGFSVTAHNTADNTLGGLNVSDVFPRYDPPGSSLIISLVGASTDSIFCVGDTLVFLASTVGTLYDDFNWDATGLGTIISGQGTGQIALVLTSNHGGQVSATDAASCGLSAFLTINSQSCCSQVVADFDIIQADLCQSIVNFVDQSTGVVANWEWDFGDGNYLNSNGHAGNDPIDPADNNGGLTSGTYSNPIHDYSTLTGGYSIIISLVTQGVGGCSLSGVSVADNYFGAGCCPGTGIYGLLDYSIFNFRIQDVNAIYSAVNNTNCTFTNPTVFNRGGSTINAKGTYFYSNGTSIQIMNNDNCSNTYLSLPAGSAYTRISEPEFNETTGTLCLIAKSGTTYNLIEVEVPSAGGGTISMNILRTISLGSNVPVAGSSTFDRANQKYYYVYETVSSTLNSGQQNNPNPLIGSVKEVNLLSGTTRSFNVKDMDGVSNNGSAFSIAPSIQELEYDAATGKIIAVATHFIQVQQTVTVTHGNPNTNTTAVIHPGGNTSTLDVNGPPTTTTVLVTIASKDVIDFGIPNGSNNAQAHIIVKGVPIDEFSSSSLDPGNQIYYVTSHSGSIVHIVNVSAKTMTTQSSGPVGNKFNRGIFEIQYLSCDQAANGMIVDSRLHEKETANKNLNATIYPNPTETGQFSIQLDVNSELPSSLEVSDMYGKIIRSEDQSGSQMVIDLSSYPKGVYFVKITNEGQTSLKKLIFK